jgi:hypothetical protein
LKKLSIFLLLAGMLVLSACGSGEIKNQKKVEKFPTLFLEGRDTLIEEENQAWHQVDHSYTKCNGSPGVRKVWEPAADVDGVPYVRAHQLKVQGDTLSLDSLKKIFNVSGMGKSNPKNSIAGLWDGIQWNWLGFIIFWGLLALLALLLLALLIWLLNLLSSFFTRKSSSQPAPAPAPIPAPQAAPNQCTPGNCNCGRNGCYMNPHPMLKKRTTTIVEEFYPPTSEKR